MNNMFLTEKDFSFIVTKTPLVAIDFCIIQNNKLLLGKRKKSPGKNLYFVPGGRIQKNEKILSACERILSNELGQKLNKTFFLEENLIGVYEHFYNDNFLSNNKFSTHYVVFAYLLDYSLLTPGNIIPNDDQHSSFLWWDLLSKKDKNMHKYLSNYIDSIKKKLKC